MNDNTLIKNDSVDHTHFDYERMKEMLNKELFIDITDTQDYQDIVINASPYINPLSDNSNDKLNNDQVYNYRLAECIWDDAYTKCSDYMVNKPCFNNQTYQSQNNFNLNLIIDEKYTECFKYNCFLGIIYDILREDYNFEGDNYLYRYIVQYANNPTNEFNTTHKEYNSISFRKQEYKKSEIYINRGSSANSNKNDGNTENIDEEARKYSESDYFTRDEHSKSYKNHWYYVFKKETHYYIGNYPNYFCSLINKNNEKHYKKCPEFDYEVVGEIFSRYDFFKLLTSKKKYDINKISTAISEICNFFLSKYQKENNIYNINIPEERKDFLQKLIIELQLETYLRPNLANSLYIVLDYFQKLGIEISKENIDTLCNINELYVGAPLILSTYLRCFEYAINSGEYKENINSFKYSCYENYMFSISHITKVTLPVFKSYIRTQLYYFVKNNYNHENKDMDIKCIHRLMIDILLDNTILSFDNIKKISGDPFSIISEENLPTNPLLKKFVQVAPPNPINNLHYNSIYEPLRINQSIKENYGKNIYHHIFSEGWMENRHRLDDYKKLLLSVQKRYIPPEVRKSIVNCNIYAIINNTK